AEKSGAFTLQDVINDVTEKMIHRHPNVFPEENPDNKGKTYTWDELKAQEKGNIRKNVLDGVSKGLPALVAAQKLQDKAGKVGFDWDELEPIWAKVSEEIGEFKEAVALKDRENMEKEAGDVLFSLINLFRWYKISGENALNRTNTKFRQRFSHVEACVNQSDRSWEDFSLAELDAFWEEAKVQEK
ncbi:MAG: MazG family protein, partial [Veillonella sp.]|nr:MazG family protein [Veillonella sp.]